MHDRSARTRVIAISRASGGGALEHPPRRGTRFGGGDQAYLLGPYDQLLQVLRRDRRVDASEPTGTGPPAPGAEAQRAAPHTVVTTNRLTT